MKRVFICRGLPGSGKSTWARSQRGAKVVSADDFFMVNGEYRFDPSKIAQAHHACFRNFLSAVERGVKTIIVDNTNMSLWELSPYALACESFGYSCTIVEFPVTIETALARNTHGVPERAIIAMAHSWEKPLPWWKVVVKKPKVRSNPSRYGVRIHTFMNRMTGAVSAQVGGVTYTGQVTRPWDSNKLATPIFVMKKHETEYEAKHGIGPETVFSVKKGKLSAPRGVPMHEFMIAEKLFDQYRMKRRERKQSLRSNPRNSRRKRTRSNPRRIQRTDAEIDHIRAERAKKRAEAERPRREAGEYLSEQLKRMDLSLPYMTEREVLDQAMQTKQPKVFIAKELRRLSKIYRGGPASVWTPSGSTPRLGLEQWPYPRYRK